MMYLTRKFAFSAAVKYSDPARSPEENADLFGSSAKLHGHNYNCEVTVQGNVDPDTGVVIHLTQFGEKLNDAVQQELDCTELHKLEYFQKKIPTPENIAVFVWEKLEKSLPGLELYRVRVEESATSAAEYYGQGNP